MQSIPELITIPRRGVNAFLVKGERPILIDTGYPGDDGLIIEVLREHGVEPEELSLIIITHCHSDHFGSLSAIKERTSAKVAIHQLEADNLERGVNTEIVSPNPFFHALLSMAKPLFTKRYSGMAADVLIGDELDLEPYGVIGKVFSTPGHTPGSVSIALEGGAVIVADLIFGSGSGWVMPPFLTYNVATLRDSIGKVLSLSPSLIYASHGGPFRPDRVRKRFQLDYTATPC